MAYKRLTQKRADIFAEAYAKTDSPQKAVQVAWPNFRDKPKSAAVKGARLMKKPEIQAIIALKLEKQSKKALKNVDKMLETDNEEILFKNTWKVIEHVRGKPVTRSVNLHGEMSVEDAIASLQ